ncbi:UDP-N-acetylmuramoyl-tripeptide--D-alanyl-D-alanine ligase [Acetobacteraceae bacterium]|nr:UDP-N-acetylmuramoyl-tripeptide--D-alanyl-D-alanine ligase [Acetobacteraceae bacterium]
MSTLWDSASLREATLGKLKADVHLKGISINSLEVEKGDLFIALRGGKRDAHEFILHALEAGASCIMADNRHFLEKNGLLENENILLVEDCFEALHRMALFSRKRFQGYVIAVTGSVGKTTTKNILFETLSAYGKTVVSKKSLNNHLGVPLTLISIPEDAKFAVLEIGMNHHGEILPLAQMVQPHMGIITTINKAHAGNMGGETGIASEKATLFQSLPKDGIALYGDFPEKIKNIIEKSIPKNVKKYTIGKKKENNFYLHNERLFSDQSYGILEYEGQCFNLEVNAPGEHLLEDATLAISAILALDLNPSEALKALQNFKPSYGRGEKHQLQNNITLIDETHNASPASVQAAIKTLSLQKANRKIAILGDMLELGEFSKSEHLSLAPLLKKEKIILFACGQEIKPLFDSLPIEFQGGYAPSSDLLIAPIQKYLKTGDYIVAKGSHSMKIDKIVEALKLYFSLNTKEQRNSRHAI